MSERDTGPRDDSGSETSERAASPLSEVATDDTVDTASGGDPILVGEAVTKRFGGLTALDAVDLQLHEGEILGLIGPNGAGKTTLFNCMSGVYRPTAGTIRMKGQDITEWKPHQIAHHGLARTFQITRPIEQLTVLENVMIGAHIRTRRRSEAAEIARKTLESLNIADLADRNAGELTIGNQKIMELGRVIATDPDVVFVDEIMAGLTPAETDEVLSHLREIRSHGTSLFVIEHDMRAIMEISDRVMVLDQGQLIAVGTPEEIANDERVVEVYLGEGGIESIGDPTAGDESSNDRGHNLGSAPDGGTDDA